MLILVKHCWEVQMVKKSPMGMPSARGSETFHGASCRHGFWHVLSVHILILLPDIPHESHHDSGFSSFLGSSMSYGCLSRLGTQNDSKTIVRIPTEFDRIDLELPMLHYIFLDSKSLLH